MTGGFSKLVAVLLVTTVATLLLSRLVIGDSEEEFALLVMGPQAELHAETLAATPPTQRREEARRIAERLQLDVLLEPGAGGSEPRAEWRGSRLYVVVQVPEERPAQSVGQVALGPLPPGPVAGLPSALALALLVSLVVAALVAWPIVRRIRALETLATRMCAGDFSARTTRSEGDPFDSLGGSLNQLADRIGQLLTDERDLLRTVAHEVRAPIARMRFRVDKLHRRADEGSRKDSDGLVNDLGQVDNLFDELLTYVAFDEFDQDRPKLQTCIIRLGACVRRIVNEVTATSEDLEVRVRGDLDACVVANQKLFDRALTNILLNAIAYGGPVIKLSVREFDAECIIDVQDSGPGIPELDRPKVIRPFVRMPKKKDTRGTGLGLAIVSRIMRLHGGRLHILDAPGGGASIQLAWKKDPPRTHFGGHAGGS
ncbi:MAG: ATP-binding protein [Nannocystales bacterium]